MDPRRARGDALVSASIYLEGGASGPGSKMLQIRCREGFRKLLERCGYDRRMPRLTACGSRGNAFADFCTAHAARNRNGYIALWVDSEDPVQDPEAPWAHLRARDGWIAPPGAVDDQVLLMTTCMETWIVADRAALAKHYGANLVASALPPLVNLESRSRHDVQDRLTRATRGCSNAYAKGTRSFDVLGELSPDTLANHLPSFTRARRLLGQAL